MAMAYFGLRPAESVSLGIRSLSVPKADVLLSNAKGSRRKAEKNPDENR